MQQSIIVDLDGTLCDISHRVHHIESKPKDYDAFYGAMADDKVITGIQSLIHAMRQDDYNILFVTGRPEQYRGLTEQWLLAHVGAPFTLLMRTTGDYRTDDIVKREIYEKHIKPYEDIAFVIEDRSRVVKMWRSLGLLCLQVADGDY